MCDEPRWRIARAHLKTAAALKDYLSIAVNKDLIRFVGFGVTVANQRVVVSCWLRYVSTAGLFVGPYPFSPPVWPLLFSCAITPRAKATNAVATAAATLASIDNFIIPYPVVLFVV